MDLVQLRYFVRVAQLKSFTKASKALHITQPALTRQVLLLEEELNVALLYRHSRGVEPTEAGARLASGAESIFRAVQDVRALVAESTSTVAGVLRIGFPPSLGGFVVGAAVQSFQRTYPDVRFELREGLSSDLQDHLLGDRLDIAILMRGADFPLISVPLCVEDLWVVRPVGSKGTGESECCTLDDLAHQALIQPCSRQMVRQYLDSEASRLGITLNVIAEADGLAITKDLVRRGVGAHISPYSGIGADIKRGVFSGGPVKDLAISRYIARRVDRPLTVATAKFQEALLATVHTLHLTDAAIRPMAA
ncbi:LysR family transcriptional regulator [Achromobacter sp. UBA2119]|uniref:LysR family transcriptional regulator n=1 Tax=Achromobacter sp. UBA2119 TaxID=1945911 RepID=UPI00257C6975|nr:LysR family transcriptional regulator [Achromobacter sp. UBA2119]